MRFHRLAAVALTTWAGLSLHAAATPSAIGQTLVAVGNNAIQEEGFRGGIITGTSGPGGVPSLSVRNFESGPPESAPVSNAVISFDLTDALASGASIASATLQLNVTSFTSSTVGVLVESFSYDPARPQDFFSFAPLTEQAFFPVTSLGEIQVALSTPEAFEVGSNRAIGIRLTGGSTANVQFDGTTAFNFVNRPRLSVTLVPEPASSAFILMGAAGLLARRRR